MKIGILGAGKIAAKMARTLRELGGGRCYAVASRDIGKARAFADEWGFSKAYGSYEEMLGDPEVELVYVATPHSHHYAHCKLCIGYGKPVLCEKAFMANAREAREIIALARSKGVFISEAIWTRFLPVRFIISDLLDKGAIGEPYMIYASMGYPISGVERIRRPELCGGALLDIGVYCINFARMYFGGDVERVASHCTRNEFGMDMQESVSMIYRDGRIANLQASALVSNDREAVISGSRGYLKVDNINNPQLVSLFDQNHVLVGEYPAPRQISGYEYEVLACEKAVSEGMPETEYMPHEETIAVMEFMDGLRREWGVVYPMD